MKVKICGVTTASDARTCCQLGADAIGLNFYPASRRFITRPRAAKVAAAVTPLVSVVGVFVNASLTVIRRTIDEVGLHAVQLHGQESEAFARQVPCPVIRVAAVQPGGRLQRLPRAALVLLDAAQPGHGGGGLRFDWTVAKRVAARRPMILAGGLTPENVAEAIRLVRPYGVDVASGVERAPGRKDHHKLAAFLSAARGAV